MSLLLLQPLARLFDNEGFTLYAVGGMVRNPMLGLPITDMDVCSAMTPDGVIALCEKHGLKHLELGAAFGMIAIQIDCGGEKRYVEHTTFRSDAYDGSGAHRPASVRFSNSIEADAFRRDFTVNAMYRDILTGELIDPTGGGEDLKWRVLRATSKDPAIILRDDGLRIMRLARFAAELNFTPEPATFEAAKAYAYLLKDISGERIQAELNKILLSDVKYPSIKRIKTAPWDNAPFLGLSILSGLLAYKYFLPELERCRGVEQKAQYHAFDVLGHSLRVAACMPPALHMRLAGLLHDIGKPVALEQSGRMYDHDKLGVGISREILYKLRYSNEIRDKVLPLIGIHMFDLDNRAKDSTLRKRFAQWGERLALELADIREADVTGSGVRRSPVAESERWRALVSAMKRESAPFSEKELKCTGADIMRWLNIGPSGRVGEIKRALLRHCAVKPSDNTPERLERMAREIMEAERVQTVRR